MMVKHFNIIMAAIISGIVALFTSFLGVSGTVIGSVISSFLYQLLSGYFEEKTENIDFSKSKGIDKSYAQNSGYGDYGGPSNSSNLASKIAFIFPIVVVIIVECLFFLTSIHYNFLQLFHVLEAATSQNLFRVMGIGLLIISLFPMFKPDKVERVNGFLVALMGLVLLLRGLMDFNSTLINFFYNFVKQFDLVIAIIVIIVLLIVVLNVLREGFSLSSTNSNLNQEYNARRINTSDYDDYNFGDPYYDEELNTNNQGNYYMYDDYSDGYPRDYADNYSNYPNNHDSYYDENIPIYEEDYIYVTDPNNPNRTVKKKILKKVKHSNNDFRR